MAIISSFPSENDKLKNIVDGTGTNSVRSTGAATESDTYTVGDNSVALGNDVEASGASSFACGSGTEASGSASFACGARNTASESYATATGCTTTASGIGSFAKGYKTVAKGSYSSAEGNETLASSSHQHVQGQFNIEDAYSKYAHIVGNGTADNARSNAHTVDWSGTGWFAGDVYVGGTGQDDGEKLVKVGEALPISGGTLSGNLTVVKSSGSVIVSVNNTSVGKINLQVSDSGNRGLYDSINEKWVLYSDSNNLTKVGGGQTVTEPCLRNIDAGTTALTSGSSSLTTGVIYIQYE